MKIETILKTKSPQRIIPVIEDSLYDLYSLFAHKEMSEISDEIDINWVAAKNSPWPNIIFDVNIKKSDIDERVRHITRRIQEGSAPPVWLIGPKPRHEDLRQSLAHSGYKKIEELSGMAVELKNVKAPDNERIKFKIINVLDHENLDKWLEVSSIGLFQGKPLDKNLFTPLLSKNEIRLYLGFYKDRPVASSMLILSKGVAGIFFVSVLPAFRGRGFGKSITSEPLIDARKAGYIIGVLQATGLGEKVYKSIGFREYFKFNIFKYEHSALTLHR